MFCHDALFATPYWKQEQKAVSKERYLRKSLGIMTSFGFVPHATSIIGKGVTTRR